MLPQMPRALNPDYDAERRAIRSPADIPQPPEGEPRIDHHCQICPTCSHQLEGHRCKLVCTHCGYYMSCADYY
jgi:hypothetical protein